MSIESLKFQIHQEVEDPDGIARAPDQAEAGQPDQAAARSGIRGRLKILKKKVLKAKPNAE